MPLRARGFHGTELYSAPTACGRKAFFLELLSVLPSHVRSRRRGIGHVASNLRHDALVEGSSTFEVRNVPATHVAVGLSATVFKVGDAKRVFRRFEKVLNQVHGVIQIPRIHVANGEVDFSGKLGAKPRKI